MIYSRTDPTDTATVVLTDRGEQLLAELWQVDLRRAAHRWLNDLGDALDLPRDDPDPEGLELRHAQLVDLVADVRALGGLPVGPSIDEQITQLDALITVAEHQHAANVALELVESDETGLTLRRLAQLGAEASHAVAVEAHGVAFVLRALAATWRPEDDVDRRPDGTTRRRAEPD